MNSSASARLALSILFGFAVGAAILNVLPLASKNVYYLLALPMALFVVFLVMTQARWVVLLLLFTRVLMDPLLEHTRVNLMGENLGLGAVINLFIIAFAGYVILMKPKLLTEHPVCKRWIVFLLICAAGVLYSPVAGKAVRTMFILSSYLAVLLVAFYFIKDDKDRKFWIRVLLYSSILPVLFANWDLARGGIYYSDAGFRIRGGAASG